MCINGVPSSQALTSAPSCAMLSWRQGTLPPHPAPQHTHTQDHAIPPNAPVITVTVGSLYQPRKAPWLRG